MDRIEELESALERVLDLFEEGPLGRFEICIEADRDPFDADGYTDDHVPLLDSDCAVIAEAYKVLYDGKADPEEY